MSASVTEPAAKPADADGLVTRVLCFLGIHRWARWETIETGDIYAVRSEPRCIGRIFVQQRKAACCGKAQIDTQHWTFARSPWE